MKRSIVSIPWEKSAAAAAAAARSGEDARWEEAGVPDFCAPQLGAEEAWQAGRLECERAACAAARLPLRETPLGHLLLAEPIVVEQRWAAEAAARAAASAAAAAQQQEQQREQEQQQQQRGLTEGLGAAAAAAVAAADMRARLRGG
ncbi:hypothetical protein MNEG_5571 [Monoraphidium neglectum]|uniref:Uncharacterized protein n=1 Tax=Monoraphidium neglectum TaxID=145388 RepID=A0A0D2MPE1_9CHLO|nr:hypothetical protein MNEG_5571 [Monoraphidium neglectum]KIZ02387.1 hypothetical protein MNEG_5571 [Monoraphidium neglectum]|eukprot:XP_013901406.1 hypothetical protein MNEG_5571 [Monoraphidium neglectum]